jgi:hypothetical protein
LGSGYKKSLKAQSFTFKVQPFDRLRVTGFKVTRSRLKSSKFKVQRSLRFKTFEVCHAELVEVKISEVFLQAIVGVFTDNGV